MLRIEIGTALGEISGLGSPMGRELSWRGPWGCGLGREDPEREFIVRGKAVRVRTMMGKMSGEDSDGGKAVSVCDCKESGLSMSEEKEQVRD